jgi:1A family penicillin-binding protein
MKKRLLLIGGVFMSMASMALAGLLAGGTIAFYSWHLSDKDRLMNHKQTGLVLEDHAGDPFFTFYQGKPQNYVTLDQIPLHTRQAIIAIEDKEFYQNPGFSLRGTLRAFRANLQSGAIVQGGSTISQQVIKNTLLTPKQNIIRKFQEVVLAYELNRRYSKDEILEMYVNSAYFGEGAFGIDSATAAYFGKSASELNLAESALLSALLPAPSHLSPKQNDGSQAKARQELVLSQMVAQGYLSQAEANQAANTPIALVEAGDEINNIAPHFALFVRDQLIAQYGEEYIIRSGFTVKTTLDRSAQGIARSTLARQVSTLTRHRASNGAVVVLEPETGHIMAMVGSISWHQPEFGKVNMATSPRQSGSAFKPVVYSLALERGLVTPATIIDDAPKEYPVNYRPVNYDRQFRGPVTVRRALANSLNVPSVEIMNQLGVTAVLTHSRDLGISSLGSDPSQYGLSLVLGSGEVSLLELTSAYGVFANDGVLNSPVAITQITDKYGRLVRDNNPRTQRVIRPETAFLISSILSDRVSRQEVFGSILDISKTAAVKTGTTNSFRDALTVGYNPNLVVGVWVGNNDNRPMDSVAGSLGAAPIWKQVMENLLQGQPESGFTIPPSIISQTVCPYAGYASNQASVMMEEYFIAGMLPENRCHLRPTPTLPPDPPVESDQEGEPPAIDPPEPNPPPEHPEEDGDED